MKILNKPYYGIYFGKYYKLLKNIFLNKNFFSKKILLLDINTKKYCLHYFLSKTNLFNKYYLINIFSGEEEKNIYTCKKIWKKLIKLNADRNSIVINLGGGVITDMGGFACSVFKRGLNFINIPTTLLSMIDASIGGKTAINFFSLKNEIGLFNDSKIILIDKNYLKTLSEDEIKSGLSEILKYGLIYDINLWNLLKIIVFSKIKYEIIYKSIIRKYKIIEKDYKEKGLRKILNFGHTIGHAIESYFIYNLNKRLSHGHSIAIGMICESWISYKMKIIKKTEFEEIYNVLSILYKKIKIYNSDIYKILYFMKHDKKNKNKKIKFSLIKEIGYCLYNIEVDYELIKESIKNYLF
ncbi:3-dehydroquinate synthase [Candidatus Karelsulcia muelleri]|uniref:3-dehydroquinate synthase n=1 Tax=Candidatus Karelsulcia muelleri TaxID=336810 RepID=A0A654M5I0_9FLAO|nr:3-dehydroquinate synthase [Candidatus Karelsulcia muelleri]AGS33298.1 3-dehydroquinate synthase [Candidatus Karelsulcia muelleri str. Sulcia-ALF]ALP70228.1 3-dehydroquinate synthase [Candidatus Karelsulcia muelleri]QND78285.1 3-dehydroquinate synthase [Candidatus Karelsulcia muelleri]